MVNPEISALTILREAPVIPVITIHDVAHAVPLARALVAGGLRVLEVTLRTPQALAAIEAIAREVPQALVGAGSVRNPAMAQAAKNAGAQLLVSPGYTQALGQACQRLQIPLLPGVATSSEIMAAQDDGYQALKFFPASCIGGRDALKAFAGPFPDAVFCPTGGITLQTAPDYLALPNVACVGGSWLTPVDALAQGDWVRVQALAAQAMKLRP